MKRSIIVLVSLFFILRLNAQQENTVKVALPINEITVYLTGGEVKSNIDVKLKKGKNLLVFQNISEYMLPKSIQVSFDGKIDIQSITSETNFLKSESFDPKNKTIKDSLDFLKNKIASIGNQIDAFNTEKALLVKNQFIGGNNNGIPLAELQKAAEYHRTRTLEINNSLWDLNKQLTNFQNIIQKIEKQLEELNLQNNPQRKEIMIDLISETDQTSQFKIRYLVQNTGWEPSYDIVVTDISKPLTLKYKAKVYNNTGISWDNVKMKLSTADPSVNASKPTLDTWTLDYQSNDYDNNNNNDINKAYQQSDQNKGDIQDDKTQKYKTIKVSELSFEFQIARPYTIPANAKPYSIDITTYTVNAAYQYFALPKADKDVFLLARITGWDTLNLIDGTANVYFGDTYIGESDISTGTIDDTLDLSLGRDTKVLASRTKKQDFSIKTTLGTNKKESFTYEIVLKNNRNTTVNMVLQDQVPISKQGEITVDVSEISGAAKDDITGKLEWIVKLNPGETKKYIISYSVKYPKNRKVNVKKARAAKSMMF
jgi:uncharacterized protein (TIGR02231 family)